MSIQHHIEEIEEQHFHNEDFSLNNFSYWESLKKEIASLQNPKIKREENFNYTISYGGGVGPDVWDKEVQVSAVNIQHAISQVISDVEEVSGWIFMVSQND